MNCPYCQNEMEQGEVNTTASRPSYIQQVFVTEEESQKGFIEQMKEAMQEMRMGIFSEHSISLSTSEVAYRCEQCGKVFAEYDIQQTDQ